MSVKLSICFIFLLIQGISTCEGETLKEDKTAFNFEPIIEVNGLGKIRGTIQSTYLTHRKYSSFTGIPYGKIVKRFAPPEDLTRLTTSSEDVFDGTQMQIPCPQIAQTAIVPLSHATVEDCLTLNVYTPKRTNFSSNPFPVLFFIHGGWFIRWSGNMWNAGRLLERDVVLVTINYRLGVLGFLCLGNDDAPGNAGMYDMVSALRWVNRYIKYFGGDESKVTLIGESAGGASVSWLLDSPLARGLFHGAIAMSGADVDIWAIQDSPIENALSAAKTFNCSFLLSENNYTFPDTAKIFECMNRLPTSAFSIPLQLNTFHSALSVQTFNLSIPKFAPKDPRRFLVSGKENPVPLIIGTTKTDGSIFASRLYTKLAVNNLQKNPEFLRTQLLPLLYAYFGLIDSPPGFYDSLTKFYFGDTAQSGNFSLMAPGLNNFYSTFDFKIGALRVGSTHSQVNDNTYVYSFDYVGSHTYYSILGGLPQVPRGAAHTDDLFYIFNQEQFTRPRDFKISNFMVNSFVNFATSGNPNYAYLKDKNKINAWPKWTNMKREFIKIKSHIRTSKGLGYWTGVAKPIKG